MNFWYSTTETHICCEFDQNYKHFNLAWSLESQIYLINPTFLMSKTVLIWLFSQNQKISFKFWWIAENCVLNSTSKINLKVYFSVKRLMTNWNFLLSKNWRSKNWSSSRRIIERRTISIFLQSLLKRKRNESHFSNNFKLQIQKTFSKLTNFQFWR